MMFAASKSSNVAVTEEDTLWHPSADSLPMRPGDEIDRDSSQWRREMSQSTLLGTCARMLARPRAGTFTFLPRARDQDETLSSDRSSLIGAEASLSCTSEDVPSGSGSPST